MSIPPVNPLPFVPQNVDPRFRYGTRAIPETYPQATSRFYLPPQRDSRFWPLKYEDYDNECFDALERLSSFLPCSGDSECHATMGDWCDDLQHAYIATRCVGADPNSGLHGVCVFEFDKFNTA